MLVLFRYFCKNRILTIEKIGTKGALTYPMTPKYIVVYCSRREIHILTETFGLLYYKDVEVSINLAFVPVVWVAFGGYYNDMRTCNKFII